MILKNHQLSDKKIHRSYAKAFLPLVLWKKGLFAGLLVETLQGIQVSPGGHAFDFFKVKEADDAFKSKHANDVASKEVETKQALEEVDRLAAENKEEMIQMLIDWCTNIEPQLHENLALKMSEETRS